MNDKLKSKPSLPKTTKSVQILNNNNKKVESMAKNHFYDNSDEIVKSIQESKQLRNYRIRTLVEQAEVLGGYLKEQDLKTNQIRKFLDAINRIKFGLSQINEEPKEVEVDEETKRAKVKPENLKLSDSNVNDFSQLDAEIIMLKPKLLYAAHKGKKKTELAIKSLGKVLAIAVDTIEKPVETFADFNNFKLDFNRLVQLIESIIAYHKAAGGE